MKISSATRSVLKFIGMGLVYYVAASSPRGAKLVIKEFQKMSALKAYRHRKKLERLEREGLIILGGEKIMLTEEGKELVRRIQIEDITIKRTKWNGQWHLIAYDIPNTKSKARDEFRFQLKKWGLKQIQESVWVTPFECKQEVAVLAQEYGVAPFVLYLNATDLPMASRLKSTFDI